MDLKELLGEELYNQVVAKAGDKKLAVISDGNWIPKQKFDDANEEKKQYKAQVDTLNQQLGELQGKLKDNEGATATIEQLKQQIADKETELANTRKTNAIKLEVLKSNPNDVADILPHLKQDVVTIGEDGTIAGLEDQLKGLRESKPYLFKEVDPIGTGGSLGGGQKTKHDPAAENYGTNLAKSTTQPKVPEVNPYEL